MSDSNLKVIHYCWFGGKPLSDLTKKCIASWKKYLPDFEIKEWNESNFDINQCEFIKQAYEQKKWAFVADYTRLKVIEQNGGLYLDTDMEITADIYKYLDNELFLGVEDSKFINAAVIWAKSKNNIHIQNILKIYESLDEFNPTGNLYEMSIPNVITQYFNKYGYNKESEAIQILDNNSVFIYPMEYFYPLSYDHQNNKFTDKSCMIHHFDATWISKMEKFKTMLKRKNMIWVVHIIDFFINSKNFILSFLNYKDITIFVTSAVLLTLIMFAYTPILSINEKSNYLISNLSDNNRVYSVIQILTFSYLWMYILKRIRDIEINKLFDFFVIKSNNKNKKEKEVQVSNVKIKDEYKFYGTTYENKIYIVQYILTILFLLIPPVYTYLIIPNKYIVYSILLLMLVYYLYIGIRNEFKYRILGILQLTFIISSISVIFPYKGILTSVLVTALILVLMIKNKIGKKRLLVFFGSLFIFIIFCMIIKNTIFSETFKLNFNNNILNIDKVNVCDDYSNNSSEYTEFNYFKEKLEANLQNYNFNDKLSIILKPTVYIYLSIFLIIIISLLEKKKEYLILLIPYIFNMFSLREIDISNVEYALTSYLIFMFTISLLVLTLFKKVRKYDRI